MENLIVGTIIGLAVFYFVRGLYRNFRTEENDACGCGCSTCPQTSGCDQSIKDNMEFKTGCR